MIKFIHASDFHLGRSFLSSEVPSKFNHFRRNNIWLAVENMISFSIEKEIDYIFLTGDLFESDFFTFYNMQRLMQLFSKTQSYIFIISGNHDAIDKKSLYHLISLPENVFLFEPRQKKIYEDDKILVAGISYDDRKMACPEIEEPSSPSDKFKVLLLHTEVFNKNSDYMPVNILELERLNFDYIALGHIHKKGELNPKVVYSGSIEPLSFKETGNHGFYYGIYDDKQLSLKFIDCAVSIYHILDYAFTEFNIYDCCNFIKHTLENDIAQNKVIYLKLNLVGEANENIEYRELKEYIMSQVYNIKFISIEDRTLQLLDIDALKKQYEGHIIGEYISSFDGTDLSDPINKRTLEIGLKAMLGLEI